MNVCVNEGREEGEGGGGGDRCDLVSCSSVRRPAPGGHQGSSHRHVTRSAARRTCVGTESE